MTNLRHLVIRGGYLYLSINKFGYVQRIPLKDFMRAALQMENKKATINGWENCKVGSGTRTIEITPNGRYVVAACNSSNCLSIVDTQTMKTSPPSPPIRSPWDSTSPRMASMSTLPLKATRATAATVSTSIGWIIDFSFNYFN